MFKTEGFRLLLALAIVAGGAIALFFTFHSLAAQPDAQNQQSAILMQTPQSLGDSPMSGKEKQKLDNTTEIPTPPAPHAPNGQTNTTPNTPAAIPTPTPGPLPQPGTGTVPVVPAPPIDLDDPDDHDDVHDDRYDDDPHDEDPHDKD